ncbi:MAG: histidine phosphatase family protein [Myxococcota bacterium]
MELLLIRHALPLRVEREDGKPADPPLSEAGKAQAERLAAWLADDEVHAVYASPMARARETAAPLADALGVSARIDPGLVEIDHLSHTYVPMEELKAMDRDAWLELVRGGLYAGIDLDAFRDNVRQSIERIVASHSGERVAVVCHGGVINAWGGHVLGVREPFFFFDAGYTSISRFLAASSGERSLVSLNETSHLRGAGGRGAR